MIFLNWNPYFCLEKNFSLSVTRWIKVHFKLSFSIAFLKHFVPSDTFCKSPAAHCIITWKWLFPQIADLNTVPLWPIFFSVGSFFFFSFYFEHIKAMENILSCFPRVSSWLGDKLKMNLAFGEKYGNKIPVARHFKVPP